MCSDEVWQNVQSPADVKTPQINLVIDWEPQPKATPALGCVIAFVETALFQALGASVVLIQCVVYFL